MKIHFLILGFACVLFGASKSMASGDNEANFDEETNALHCATFANGHYTIDLHVVGTALTISILDRDKTAFSFRGTEHTVFAIALDTLWYINAGDSAGWRRRRCRFKDRCATLGSATAHPRPGTIFLV